MGSKTNFEIDVYEEMNLPSRGLERDKKALLETKTILPDEPEPAPGTLIQYVQPRLSKAFASRNQILYRRLCSIVLTRPSSDSNRDES